MGHSVTDSLNGRSSLFLSLSTTNTGWPTPLRQPPQPLRRLLLRQVQRPRPFPRWRPPMEPLPRRRPTERPPRRRQRPRQQTAAEVTNGEEVPASSNGSTEAEKKEETSSEAVKR